MARKVLFINMGWEQEPFLRAIQERQYEIFGYTPSSDYTKTVKCKEVRIGDIRDLTKIVDFAREIKPDAVVSDACDYSYFAQSYLAELFGLRGSNLFQAQIAVNKLLQRQVAKKKGIRVPDFIAVYSYGDAVEAAERIGYPVVVKPIDNRGSFGVTKVYEANCLKKAFLTALLMSHSRLVLVEKCIEGTEFTVDGYCIEGRPTSLAVARKFHSSTNPCVATKIIYSSRISNYKELCNYHEFVANQLGFTFGMLHGEYIVDDHDNIFLIEIANRGGGVFTSSVIVPRFSGINLVSLYIDDCLGKSELSNAPRLKENNGKKIILYFLCYPSGLVQDIYIPNEVFNDPRILNLKLMIKKGESIPKILSDADRHGFVIAELSEEESENEFVCDLINKIEVKYE